MADIESPRSEDEFEEDLPVCEHCAFFNQIINTGRGECRRHAPRPYTERDEDTPEYQLLWGTWPAVANDEWCGEFKRAKEF